MGKERADQPHARRKKKVRVDELVVAQGLAQDLKEAAALLLAGEILWGDQRLKSPGARISSEASLRRRWRRGHRYVSRGGLKLEGALDHFHLDPRGRRCLDLGMSTGGFTDCLLQRGATHVYGVDVGVGLADARLVADSRVTILEGVNARALTSEHLPEPIEICVADLSFTSLRKTIGAILFCLAPAAKLLLLVKPQFELERTAVGEGGIVRDAAEQERACREVAGALEALGLQVSGWAPAQVKGAKGNQEHLLLAKLP